MHNTLSSIYFASEAWKSWSSDGNNNIVVSKYDFESSIICLNRFDDDEGSREWLWEETHVHKAVGSNPGTIYWMAREHSLSS